MQDVGVIEGGAVAIGEGKLLGVGRAQDIAAGFTAAETIDAVGRVVVPGFVDPHTHIVFAGDRLDEFELKIKGANYLDILASGGGIISTVKKTRDASKAELVAQATERLDKMLECGTTTCEIKTGYGLNTETELKMLDVIRQLGESHVMDVVPTFLAAHAVPPEYRANPEAYVVLICEEMLPLAYNCLFGAQDGQPRVTAFADVFCENNAFDLEQSRRVLEAAKRLGFALKAHVDEFTNLGGSRMAIGLGAASIDHLDAISDEEIELLSRSDTVGIVTPTVNFNFGSREFANVRKLIDAGCAIALSTDYNPGSAPCPSQPMAMAIACRYQKLLPSEALNAVTINAAHSIGLGATNGSLEAGKLADLVIADVKDYRSLAYEFGSVQIESVMKRGNWVEV